MNRFSFLNFLYVCIACIVLAIYKVNKFVNLSYGFFIFLVVIRKFDWELIKQKFGLLVY